MKKFIRNIIPVLARIIPTPKFSNVTFYRHKQGKFLYYCMSEVFIVDDIINGKQVLAMDKILELFPKVIRISQMEFDCIHFFRPDINIVEIADDKIIADIEGDEGAYAEDDHEETEDNKLTQEP
jgi:hypothetical protein